MVRVERELTVALALDVREEQERRELSGVAVKGLPEDRLARLTPGTVKVRLEGPKSLVDQLRAEDLLAQVRLSELAPGRHSVAPAIVISSPEAGAIQVLSIEPQRIQVQIQ
jgi:YbbR domain-containing protein